MTQSIWLRPLFVLLAANHRTLLVKQPVDIEDDEQSIFKPGQARNVLMGNRQHERGGGWI